MNKILKVAQKLQSTERCLQNDVKRNLYRTGFLYIGEELFIKKPRRGQCDLWLAKQSCLNYYDNTEAPEYLLSLELKVGKDGNSRKLDKLEEQVDTYTKALKLLYPEYEVFGIGVYKTQNGFKWIDHENNKNTENKNVETDIKHLKDIIDDLYSVEYDSFNYHT